MFVITLDIDWAPDFVIRAVADKLIEKRIKATWFVTHDSKEIRRLQAYDDLFEMGLHPNLAPDSTQGHTVSSVMESLKKTLPTSKVMRSHGLKQSTAFLRTAANDFGIEIDVSLFLPDSANLAPHTLPLNDGGRGIVRIPYFWEDDIECYRPTPAWSMDNARYHVPGLKVFDFHPIHVYLNSNSMISYERLKSNGNLSDYTEASLIASVNHDSPGTGNLFDELIDHIVKKQKESRCISDIPCMQEALS